METCRRFMELCRKW
ncbi:hypothetical protein [Bacillus salipaludis]